MTTTEHDETRTRLELVDAIQKRTNRTIKAMRLIGKLGGHPELTEKDAHAITVALHDEVNALRTRLDHSPEPDFQLADYQTPKDLD